MRLCFAQPVEQRPSKHKGHQATKHVAYPEIFEWPIEKGFRLVLCFEREYEARNNSRAQEVENETRPGFQAQGAGRYTEKRGRECSNVRNRLVARCILAFAKDEDVMAPLGV